MKQYDTHCARKQMSDLDLNRQLLELHQQKSTTTTKTM